MLTHNLLLYKFSGKNDYDAFGNALGNSIVQGLQTKAKPQNGSTSDTQNQQIEAQKNGAANLSKRYEEGDLYEYEGQTSRVGAVDENGQPTVLVNPAKRDEPIFTYEDLADASQWNLGNGQFGWRPSSYMDGYWNTSHTNVAGNQESYLMNAARFVGGVTKTVGDTVTSTIEYIYNNPLGAGYDALSTVVDFAYSPIDQFTRTLGLGTTGAMDRTVARFDSALNGFNSYLDSVGSNWNAGDWEGLGGNLAIAGLTVSPR